MKFPFLELLDVSSNENIVIIDHLDVSSNVILPIIDHLDVSSSMSNCPFYHH